MILFRKYKNTCKYTKEYCSCKCCFYVALKYESPENSIKLWEPHHAEGDRQKKGNKIKHRN